MIDLTELFDYPTIAQLAKHFTQSRAHFVAHIAIVGRVLLLGRLRSAFGGLEHADARKNDL